MESRSQMTSVILRGKRKSDCSYCHSSSTKSSYGIVSPNMLVDDYQLLMDRGWRKCGTYYYKALMNKTCCPLYTIRCDANYFQSTRSQRRVVHDLNNFINNNIKPTKNISTANDESVSVASNSVVDNNKNLKSIRSKRVRSKTAPQQNIETNRITNNSNNNNAPDDLLKHLRARQKRWYRKLEKLKGQGKLNSQTDIRGYIKRYKRMKSNQLTLEEMLQFDQNPVNKLELKLVRSYPPSDDFTRTFTDSHRVYKKYQMAIHGDSEFECTSSQFRRFLCESSLQPECDRLPKESTPSTVGYGCYHLQYYLNNQLIACGVIDILPNSISSVYFYYDPDYSFLKLGVYSALRLKYQQIKGQYKPSYLLCPETYTWHPIEKCIPLLNQNKYQRFENDLTKVDENEERNLENLKLRFDNQLLTLPQLQALNEDYFCYLIDRLQLFAKYVGKICAERIYIDLR
ncbi:unnamed protein product [Didymodactylos carnosus]|uniref:Arginyl-tRNA--protein transferase 1 n=1 Tax=Didymodactylos carnosus TaxID=1234261 RepID=A0A814NV39_9BILA|nr:unnamed protein product [Didymodactylos carnosus]CAF1098420.1 unnamed protein product [Didymodactylos carnosus]CAF3714108.1 unnamed protein product [Didymodactylos carnosus]CAF3863487.1 unnamed protein product [Didymodactylos carnosus]